MKILVIEDDQTTRDFIAKALEQEGFIIDSSGDGKEGLMMAISCEYQLIVLDRMLPNLDGLKILSAIRATDNNTPVLILSALDSVDQRVEGLTAGSDDYLTKPFALAELLARINIILRRNRPVENTLNEIQINNLTQGIYHVTVSNQSNNKTLRIIVE